MTKLTDARVKEIRERRTRLDIISDIEDKFRSGKCEFCRTSCVVNVELEDTGVCDDCAQGFLVNYKDDIAALLEEREELHRESRQLKQAARFDGAQIMQSVLESELMYERNRLRTELRKTNRGVERQAHRERFRIKQIADLEKMVERLQHQNHEQFKTFVKHFERLQSMIQEKAPSSSPSANE